MKDLPEPDAGSAVAVRERASSVLRPTGALRRLDDVAIWLAGWQRTAEPTISKPACLVFVADHGVASEGVSAYPAAVTRHMLSALRAGAATASVMAGELGVALRVVDVGVGRPSGNIAKEPAMDRARFEECIAAGRAAVAETDPDVLLLGEMGIGNTTPAAAICAALFGGRTAEWVGRGTGLDDAGVGRKVRVVEQAVGRLGRLSGPNSHRPIEILRELGGCELAALAGAVIEARLRSVPVILDGYVTGAAAAPLEVARQGALAHCLASHCSAEPGHRALLERLGVRPLLDLEMRLGEASGALAALPLVRLAAAAVTRVATFEEWGIREQ